MLRLAAIFVLMGLGAFARADAPRPTPVRDIARLGPDAQLADFCVTGTVIYCDPGRRCLVLQDGDHGLFARIPLENQLLKPGDRAAVRGRLRPPHFMDATEARIVDTDAVPDALSTNGEQLVTGKVMNRRVCLTGVIRGGEGDDDSAVFDLYAGRQPVRALVRDLPAGPLRWSRYVDAEVRVTGVCAPVVDPAGRIDGVHLLVH